MAQPLLKRRLNPFLLISTVAALSLLAGVSVLYQDQISQKTSQVEDINQTRVELQATIDEQEVRIENQSRQMNALENNIQQLQDERQEINSTLTEKEETIQDLQRQLRDANQNEELETRIDNMNESIGFFCYNMDTQSDEFLDECSQWGYEVGTDEG